MYIGYVFPGQGTQYTGMCKEMYKTEKTVRECFDKAGEILGYDLAAICFEDGVKLNKTGVSQPAIFTASVSMLRLFEEKTNLKPDYVAGNSVGEFAALTAAGVLSFEDALKLVSIRANFMENCAIEKGGAMYDVKNYSFEKLENAVKQVSGNGIACISNMNGKDNNVISGDECSIERVVDIISAEGARTIKLNVSSGFHSPIMTEASEKFKAQLQKYSFEQPKCSVISNFTGKVYSSTDEMKNTLALQIISTVRWYDTMKLMESEGCTEIIEFGPKKTLKNLVVNNTSMTAYSYDANEDREALNKKYDVNKVRAIVFGEFLKAAVTSKNNNQDYTDYKTAVVENYRELEKVYLKIVNEKYVPDKHDIEESSRRLSDILKYKKVSDADKICCNVTAHIKNKLLG